MIFNKLAQDKLEFSKLRVRFLALSKLVGNSELALIEKAGFQFYSDSFFYDLSDQSFLLPIVGKKRPDPVLVREFKNLGVAVTSREVRFNELESFCYNVGRVGGLASNDEVLAKINVICDSEPRLKEKNLLLELNSRVLALHFFL